MSYCVTSYASITRATKVYMNRVRTRFGIYEKVLKMTIPISRPGKGLEMQHKYEIVWKITLAYKLYTSAVLSLLYHDCDTMKPYEFSGRCFVHVRVIYCE